MWPAMVVRSVLTVRFEIVYLCVEREMDGELMWVGVYIDMDCDRCVWTVGLD